MTETIRVRNPVVRGFHADPSVCRVGEDYYLITSSFVYYPGVPIFHSRDLVHWHQIGHILTRPEQLPLSHAPSWAGIYASSLFHARGRFWMTSTNASHPGHHFIVSAPAILGPWTDPVWNDQEGIDPSLHFLDDGTVLFTTNCSGGLIIQSLIDPDTGRRTCEPRTISRGDGAAHPEGPHLYRIDGRWYLLLAEGGTEFGHSVTIFRGDSPWGPFERCPWNPLLTHRHRIDHPFQCVGHGDLVQTPDGRWFMVCLGIRAIHYPPRHHLGRETFLAPVTWREGWPVVGRNGMLEEEWESLGTPRPWPAPATRDDFDGDRLALYWNFVRNPVPASWSLSERPGHLVLHGLATTLDDTDAVAFVSRSQQHFFCSFAASLDFAPGRVGEAAGLAIRHDERHHYDLLIELDRDGRRRVVATYRVGGFTGELGAVLLGEGLVELGIDATAREYRFWARDAGGARHDLGVAETRYLAKEVVGGFAGVHLGLYATGRGAPAMAPAAFAWCDYRPVVEDERVSVHGDLVT
jgi:alpha-N-arabinofuranosidase